MLTITLINGAKFELPSKNVHKLLKVTRLDLQTGTKTFANWYIASINESSKDNL